MIHTIYVPINNKPLPLTEGIDTQIISGILSSVTEEQGGNPDFEAEILLYLSEPSRAMVECLLSSKHRWIKAVHISIDPKFDQKSLDAIAQRMTGKEDLRTVSCYRVVPRGMLNKKELQHLRDSLLRRFGEVYIIDIPEIVVTNNE